MALKMGDLRIVYIPMNQIGYLGFYSGKNKKGNPSGFPFYSLYSECTYRTISFLVTD